MWIGNCRNRRFVDLSCHMLYWFFSSTPLFFFIISLSLSSSNSQSSQAFFHSDLLHTLPLCTSYPLTFLILWPLSLPSARKWCIRSPSGAVTDLWPGATGPSAPLPLVHLLSQLSFSFFATLLGMTPPFYFSLPFLPSPSPSQLLLIPLSWYCSFFEYVCLAAVNLISHWHKSKSGDKKSQILDSSY